MSDYRVDKSSGGAVIFPPNPQGRSIANLENRVEELEKKVKEMNSIIEKLERGE